MKKSLYVSAIALCFGFLTALNAQGLISHDFNDGDMGPFVDCTTQSPNYTRVVNNRLRTYWKESSYKSSNRMTKGAEGCGDPVHNGIGYLTYKHCWSGFTINIDEDYMGPNYEGVGSLAQIFGFDDARNQFSWSALLEIEDGNLIWIDRRGIGSSRAEVVVYENFPRGVDMDIILHAVLSDNNTGLVEVFVNGKLEYSAYNIRIGMGEFDNNDTQTNQSYTEFKIGQYNHSGAADNEIRIVDYDNISWYDGVDGYAIVDPAGGTIPTECTSYIADVSVPSNVVSGVNYDYYEGEWNSLPNFESLTPNDSGLATNINLNASTTSVDYFGYTFSGYIDVPSEGEYTFYTASDDGSALWIDGGQVVNNDGLHGVIEESGTICLEAGYHKLDVAYFEKTGGNTLSVAYAGPGISKTTSLNLVATPVASGCSLPWSDNTFTVSDETVSYSSGIVDISCASNVEVTMDLEGVGSMEDEDYLNVYYRVDGGALQVISENVNAFSKKTVSVNNITGNSIEINITGATSVNSETYLISNIMVSPNELITTTESSTITLQENATGFCELDGTVDNNHAGHTGTGFSNTANKTGNGIDWKINGEAGEYTFEWKYASTSNRSAKLVVNGATVASNIAFNTTGSWTTWNTESVAVTLSAGVKEIRLEATNDSGLGNIDFMEVTGINVATAECDTAETDCAGIVGGTATIDACGICSGGTTGVNATSPQRWYADTDGDGAGDPDTFVEECSQPNGYVLIAGDNCPNDANKNAPGDCGCGVEEGSCSGSDCNNTTAFTEAECFDDEDGVQVESSNGDGENLGHLDNGDWARYNDINLSNVNSFNAMLSARNSNRSIEIRLDSLNGTLIGTLSVPNTGEWHSYVNRTTTISSVSGTHDVFLIFKGGSFNIGSFGFTEEEVVAPTNCSDFFRGITVNHVNPGCSNNDGEIIITFLDSSDHSQIQLSIDGGDSYPVTVNDNSGAYTFNGLSVSEFEVAARYAGGDCEFNIAHVNLVPDCGDIPLNPGGVSWHDSYEANGFCWCSTNFDHDLDEKEVTINGTRFNVEDVCDELEKHPLSRDRKDGDAIYNDVQCGNGPLNDSDDEPICPGRVDNGVGDCLVIGVRWDMEWLASRSRFGGASSKEILDVSEVDYTIYPNPVLIGAEITITSDSNIQKAQLYDMSGKLVKGTVLIDNKMDINADAPGLYLLQILFESGAIELVKLVVE